jgi:hypothetical protein
MWSFAGGAIGPGKWMSTGLVRVKWYEVYTWIDWDSELMKKIITENLHLLVES